MRSLLHRKFRLPDNCSASEIVVRETNGIDEQQAAMLADARGGRTNIYAELVRLAIVEVDGKRVTQPFMEIDQWNSVTRAYARNAYDSLNDINNEMVETFIAAGEDVTPKPAVVEQEEELAITPEAEARATKRRLTRNSGS